MSAFDLVGTVALGSTLASALLTASVALAEGVLRCIVLVALQYAATWLSVRSQTVKGQPSNRSRFRPSTIRVLRGRKPLVQPAKAEGSKFDPVVARWRIRLVAEAVTRRGGAPRSQIESNRAGRGGEIVDRNRFPPPPGGAERQHPVVVGRNDAA